MKVVIRAIRLIAIFIVAVTGWSWGQNISRGDYSLPRLSQIPVLNQLAIKLAGGPSFALSPISLREAHIQHKKPQYKRVLTDHKYPDTPPSDIFNLVHYKAQDGDMAAYVTPDPKDGKQHPAVIWLHGGYGGIGPWLWEPLDKGNDQSGRGLREAGIVMMVPSFRGENRNPGTFEMFLGELDDLEFALNYLKSQPYVDPKRIYLIGHSTGGTNVLLGNEYIDGFRAAFSLGGVPDLKTRLSYGPTAVDMPFPETDEEFNLRSPRRFINDIKSPTFYFEGSESWWREFEEVEQVAQNASIPFSIYEIPDADHFNYLHAAVKLIAEKIVADTGDKTNITFSTDDIKSISQNIGR